MSNSKGKKTSTHNGATLSAGRRKLDARIYLDYAATTPLDPRVGKVMRSFLSERFGNPSSIHAEGVAAKVALDTARTTVARCLEAHKEEIVFTSGGTEANNLAMFGVLANTDGRQHLLKGAKPHVVTTNIEHASVLEPMRQLEKEGMAEVTYVSVEPNGIVKPEKILAAVRPTTVLVSVMYANNEIGTIQPIAKIGKALRDFRNGQLKTSNLKLSTVKNRLPIFHSDACQAPLYLRCLVNALGVDLLSLDAHKIYGPKGVGALYIRRGMRLEPQLFGGGQEWGMRSTTENVPAIVGFAEALRIATAERHRESERIQKLRDMLYPAIFQNNGTVVVNGGMKKGERLPNNLNISLPGVDTEFLTLELDALGIAVSTKSSCLKDEKESYVVAALDAQNHARAHSSLRFTLGRTTTRNDVKRTLQTLATLLGGRH